MVVLLDGSKSAARTAWHLFTNARRVLDFRELARRVAECGDAVFRDVPDMDMFQGVSNLDRPWEWKRTVLDRILLDGDLDGAMDLVDAAECLDGPDEPRELLVFLEQQRKFLNYQSCFASCCNPGTETMVRPPRGDLQGWAGDGAASWDRKSVQAAAALIDRFIGGRWETEVEAPFRKLFGSRG